MVWQPVRGLPKRSKRCSQKGIHNLKVLAPADIDVDADMNSDLMLLIQREANR